METMEARMHRVMTTTPARCNVTARPPTTALSAQRSSFTRPGPLIGQAATAIGTTPSARPAAMSHRRGRQRGEGGRPVGKSSSVRGKATKPGANTQVESHAKSVPSGRQPLVSMRAYLEYSQEKALRLLQKPPKRKIQPTGFSGRLRTITAPTAEKETARIAEPVASDEPISPPLRRTTTMAATEKKRAATKTRGASRAARVLIDDPPAVATTARRAQAAPSR